MNFHTYANDKFKLSKPSGGWTDVKICCYNFSASYLEDVPFDCLRGFIRLYETCKPVSFYFDSEWCETIVVVSNSQTYIIKPGVNGGVSCDTCTIDKNELAIGLISSIEPYVDEWATFYCSEMIEQAELSRWVLKSHLKKRRNDLMRLLRKLRRLVDECA